MCEKTIQLAAIMSYRAAWEVELGGLKKKMYSLMPKRDKEEKEYAAMSEHRQSRFPLPVSVCSSRNSRPWLFLRNTEQIGKKIENTFTYQ